VLIETGLLFVYGGVAFCLPSLQSGETNLCLVGGASLMLSPEPFITYSHARMMAADGRCKTFDASADGYVRGKDAVSLSSSASQMLLGMRTTFWQSSKARQLTKMV
jgi:hypothetical protein